MPYDMTPPTAEEAEAICAARVGPDWSTRSAEHQKAIVESFLQTWKWDPMFCKEIRVYRAGIAEGERKAGEDRLSLTREEARLVLFGGSTIKKSGNGHKLLERVRAFVGEEDGNA